MPIVAYSHKRSDAGTDAHANHYHRFVKYNFLRLNGYAQFNSRIGRDLPKNRTAISANVSGVSFLNNRPCMIDSPAVSGCGALT